MRKETIAMSRTSDHAIAGRCSSSVNQFMWTRHSSTPGQRQIRGSFANVTPCDSEPKLFQKLDGHAIAWGVLVGFDVQLENLWSLQRSPTPSHDRMGEVRNVDLDIARTRHSIFF